MAYQSDSPEGLWGRAAALAMLDERWDQAFAVYEQALRWRTGLVELRADLVQDLIRAGRFDTAAKQLTEALEDMGNEHAEKALLKAAKAVEKAPWNDLALIVKGAALAAFKHSPVRPKPSFGQRQGRKR